MVGRPGVLTIGPLLALHWHLPETPDTTAVFEKIQKKDSPSLFLLEDGTTGGGMNLLISERARFLSVSCLLPRDPAQRLP